MLTFAALLKVKKIIFGEKIKSQVFLDPCIYRPDENIKGSFMVMSKLESWNHYTVIEIKNLLILILKK